MWHGRETRTLGHQDSPRRGKAKACCEESGRIKTPTDGSQQLYYEKWQAWRSDDLRKRGQYFPAKDEMHASRECRLLGENMAQHGRWLGDL